MGSSNCDAIGFILFRFWHQAYLCRIRDNADSCVNIHIEGSTECLICCIFPA